MNRFRTLTLLAFALPAVASPVLVTGCSGEPEEVDEQAIRDELARDVWRVAEYTVRGEVVALPTEEEPMQVRHEAIPEFRGPRSTGMDVMTMGFPLGEGVSLEGVEVGDKLNLTFSVDYEEGWSPVAFRVIELEELPAETELDFTPLPDDESSEG